jgi:hypothetical protein
MKECQICKNENPARLAETTDGEWKLISDRCLEKLMCDNLSLKAVWLYDLQIGLVFPELLL